MNPYKQNSPRKLVREMAVAERPQNRIHLLPPAALSSAEILAVLLGTKDAYALALEMLQWAGTLPKLLQKSDHEIKQFSGVGDSHVARLKAAHEFGKRILTQPFIENPVITSPADAANYLMADMMHLEREHVYVVTVNTRNAIIRKNLVYKGTVNSSLFRCSEILKYAITQNAPAIIIAHNHPSGDPSPSPEDIKVTKTLYKSAKLLDIDLLDHIIIGQNKFVSLKERGLGFD